MQKISNLALIPLMNNNSWDVPDILFYSRCAAEKCFYLLNISGGGGGGCYPCRHQHHYKSQLKGFRFRFVIFLVKKFVFF